MAANTERSIPLGAESDHEAWSSVGGTWRIVRVRYPRRIPPGWGRPPWQNAFAGLFNLAIAVVVGGIALPALYSAQGDVLKNATTQDHRVAIGVSIGIGVVAIGAALLALRGIWMLVLGVLDIGRGRTIDGRVLRVRRRNEKTYIAVDDGTDDHIAAWISTKSFLQGADVHARVATHNGYVREMTVTRRRRRRPWA